MVKSAVFMILILDAVNRDDKFVFASLIDSRKDKIESQAKKNHKEKYTEIKCLTIDGKKSPTSIGHNQTKRKHHMTFVVEPQCKYLDHAECGETGEAMAAVTISVIESTNSGGSCDTIGAGKKF